VVAVSLIAVSIPSFAQLQQTIFNLVPEKKVVNCLSANDGNSPAARVTANHGNLNDVVILNAEHLKPIAGFELFTVPNSSLLANGRQIPTLRTSDLPGTKAISKQIAKAEST